MGKGNVRFCKDNEEAMRAVGEGENVVYFGGTRSQRTADTGGIRDPTTIVYGIKEMMKLPH